MKKIIFLLSITLFFMIGLVIGNTNSSYSKLVEDAKNEFEDNIQLPDNDYTPKTLKPKEGFVNKIANFVDNVINKISDILS